MNKKPIAIISLCVAAIAVTFIYIKKAPAGKGQMPGMQGAPAGKGMAGGKGGPMGATETMVTVKTQEAKKTVLHDYVNTNGEIESKVSVDVFPDIGGKLYKDSIFCYIWRSVRLSCRILTCCLFRENSYPRYGKGNDFA